jgi:hypothetical protein
MMITTVDRGDQIEMYPRSLVMIVAIEIESQSAHRRIVADIRNESAPPSGHRIVCRLNPLVMTMIDEATPQATTQILGTRTEMQEGHMLQMTHKRDHLQRLSGHRHRTPNRPR